ncbi:MAG: hypothetical protein ACP5O6_11900 [Candidatus Baltobacteraceae bacterium]
MSGVCCASCGAACAASAVSCAACGAVIAAAAAASAEARNGAAPPLPARSALSAILIGLGLVIFIALAVFASSLVRH